IVRKRGKLTESERGVIEGHPEAGYELLKRSTSPDVRLGADTAPAHPEPGNGSGYPGARSGENIPLEGRIPSVADVFDALSSNQPQRPAFPVQLAADQIRSQSGAQFDP